MLDNENAVRELNRFLNIKPPDVPIDDDAKAAQLKAVYNHNVMQSISNKHHGGLVHCRNAKAHSVHNNKRGHLRRK